MSDSKDILAPTNLGDVAARWDHVRRLALFGILPLLSLYFVSYLVVWATASGVWISGWGLLEIGPGYWRLACSWEVLKIALWVVTGWTWIRFLFATSSVLRSYRDAGNSEVTPSPNPLFSTSNPRKTALTRKADRPNPSEVPTTPSTSFSAK